MDNELEKRMGKAENRITALETAQPYIKELVEQNTHAYKQLAVTMTELQKTMITMEQQLKTQNTKIDGMQKAIEDGHKETQEKVSAIENKGKFDIIAYLKNNWVSLSVLICIGLAWVANIATR